MTPVGCDRWSLLGQTEQAPYHPGFLFMRRAVTVSAACLSLVIQQQSFLLVLIAGCANTDFNTGHGCPCLPSPCPSHGFAALNH